MRDKPTLNQNVILAHQWLVADRGAEVVLREFISLFPGAPIACLVKGRAFNPPWLQGCKVIESPLARLPGARRYYRQLLPLHPWAIHRLRAPSNTRFVLSGDAAMIKGLSFPSDARQVCYCHSPPRYLWDQMDNYLVSGGLTAKLQNAAFASSVRRCRRFDRSGSGRVDRFIANSAFVANRISGVYSKEAEVIFPPVHVEDFAIQPLHKGYYLIVSQLVPYKRIDIAVAACSQLGVPLVVIGEGSEIHRLQRIAGPSIEFRGRLPRSEVKSAVEQCRAFIYPQVEDFGITAVEAQAAGKPVIALRAGGALETITDGETGVFFEDQNTGSLAEAIKRFETMDEARRIGREPCWSTACRRSAERFRPEVFRAKIKAFLTRYYPEIFGNYNFSNQFEPKLCRDLPLPVSPMI